jgi:hypothetical protein
MGRSAGATAEQTMDRVEATADLLLTEELSIYEAQKHLEKLYTVSARTAKRYVEDALVLNKARYAIIDAKERLGMEIERISRRAKEYRVAGEFKSAASVDTAILSALASISRADTFSETKLDGKSVGFVEPTEQQRRKYRSSVYKLKPDKLPF